MGARPAVAKTPRGESPALHSDSSRTAIAAAIDTPGARAKFSASGRAKKSPRITRMNANHGAGEPLTGDGRLHVIRASSRDSRGISNLRSYRGMRLTIRAGRLKPIFSSAL